jgi:hypothetical protein
MLIAEGETRNNGGRREGGGIRYIPSQLQTVPVSRL